MTVSEVRKAIAALLTGVAGWLVQITTSDSSHITSGEWVSFATLFITAALVFLVPNDTPTI